MRQNQEGLPMEEWSRWLAYYRDKGNAALKELEKIAPEVAEAIRKAQKEEARRTLNRGRNLLRPEDEDLI